MRIKDIINPKRQKSFIIFLLKKFLRWIGETDTYLEQHEMEQYMYRLLKCPDCVAAGKCIKHKEGEEPCNCHTIGRMNNKTDTCPNNNWGMMQSKTDWEYTKKILGIEIILKQKNIE